MKRLVSRLFNDLVTLFVLFYIVLNKVVFKLHLIFDFDPRYNTYWP